MSTSGADWTATLAAVDRLSLLLRTIAVHGSTHPMSKQAAGAAAESIAQARPPFALQFVSGGLFRDRTMVPIKADQHERVQQLALALANLAVHELAVTELVSSEGVLQLGEALARGARGESHALSHIAIRGLDWRAIPGLGPGSPGASPEVFAVNQVLRALQAARQVAVNPRPAWPREVGLGIIRRLERALDANASAAERAMEMAPGSWGVARRSVSAALFVLRVLRSIGGRKLTRRAAAHATLALGLTGYRPRGGAHIHQAATALREKLMGDATSGAQRMDAHLLRAAIIVHYLAAIKGRAESSLRALGLVQLAYYLELHRCPDRATAELTLVDLMAFAVKHAGIAFDPDWVRAAVHAVGPMPSGTPVRLAGGELAVAIGPGAPGEVWRPAVVCGGQISVPSHPVRYATPLER